MGCQLLIVIFGASGDLARKKIYPSLWELYKNANSRQKFFVVGFSRTLHTIESFIESFKSYCVIGEQQTLFAEFTNILRYHSGDYGNESFIKFEKFLVDLAENDECERVFYFALPPSVYVPISSLVRAHCCETKHKIKVVFEKPFGYDLNSAIELNQSIKQLFSEDSVYRIDHYLGKEMVQNILVLRLANSAISALWSRENISCVVINFKEDIGTFGRGNYYDASGVIRDVIQNHTMQVLSLLAMEPPKSLSYHDIQKAKIDVLKCFIPIEMKDVVVGQYVACPNASPDKPASKGYKDDPLVPKESKTPTFATIVTYIDNERWKGVPFILKAGKALNERKAEIRIQFKQPSPNLFQFGGMNELVIRMQPNEAIYFKIQTRLPGFGFKIESTELDLTFKRRHEAFKPREAYEKLIFDILEGSHVNFVSSEELEESWKLFTPLLVHLEKNNVATLPYTYGSRGPKESDELIKEKGFVYDENYKWPSQAQSPAK